MIGNLKKYAVLFFALTALTAGASAQNRFCNVQLKVAELGAGTESVEVKASSAVLQRAGALTTIASTLKDEMPFFSGLPEGYYAVVVSSEGYKKTVKKFRLNCSAELIEQKVVLWKGLSSDLINFIDNAEFLKPDDDLSYPSVSLTRKLVQPSYPSKARAKGASGQVKVQVTIDEQGNVISADVLGKAAFSLNKAREGYIDLWTAAEEAALQSKFYPTYLVNSPVKVTGTIIYNFVP